MGEEVAQQTVGQNNTCAAGATPAIIPASELRQLLYEFVKARNELIAVKRSVSRGIEQISSIVDAIEQQLD